MYSIVTTKLRSSEKENNIEVVRDNIETLDEAIKIACQYRDNMSIELTEEYKNDYLKDFYEEEFFEIICRKENDVYMIHKYCYVEIVSDNEEEFDGYDRLLTLDY